MYRNVHAREARAQQSPIAKGNLWIRVNLVRRSAYAQKTVRTDAEGRGAKLSRVGKGIPDAYLAFGFGAK